MRRKKRGPGAEDGEAPRRATAERVPLWSRPGFLVRRLHQIHSAIFLDECQEFGVTAVQYGLLTALKESPGIDQRTLGSEVGLDRTNVADVIERLRERGLVRRERNLRDRRSKDAYLTPEGERLLEAMYPRMQDAQDRLLSPLQPAFRAAFMAMLVDLVEGNNGHSRAELRPDFRMPERPSVRSKRREPRADPTD